MCCQTTGRTVARKAKTRPPPEFRLWLSYAGFLLTIVGVVVLLVRTQQAP